MAKWAEGTSPYGDALIKVGYKRTPGGMGVSLGAYGFGKSYFLTIEEKAVQWISGTEDAMHETKDYEPLELGELHERSRD